jgi:hypothetical protein
VIDIDKPSLPWCAFGAGAAHAAVIALILPVMITLPAPKDEAQGTVAIQVSVRSASPSPFIQAAMAEAAMTEAAPSDMDAMPRAALEGEGDVDEGPWITPEAEEITGALPEMQEQVDLAEPEPLVEQAALSPPVGAAPPMEAALPVAVPEGALVEDLPARVVEEKVELGMVASTEAPLSDEPNFMPDVVPRPIRKPALGVVEEKAKVVDMPRPAPRQRVTNSRPRTAAKPFKGILGGTRATPMEEFPFRAGR